METAYWLAVDVVGAVALFTCGVLGAWSWRAGGSRLDGSLYWVLAGVGLIYLAVDERLSLHERMARALEARGFDPPLVNHADDAVLLTFALAGLVVSLLFAGELMRDGRVLAPLLAGAMVMAAALVIDAFAPVEGWAPVVEEHAELAGCALFVVAFVRHWRLAVVAGAGAEGAARLAAGPISTH